MKKTTSAFLIVLTLLAATVGASAQAGISSLPGGGWWEASQIMNVGDDTATVQFTPVVGLGVSGATAAGASTTIDQDRSKTFGPGFGDVALTMDDGFKGSAVVSSDQPIVAIGAVQNNYINLGGDSVGVSGGRAGAQYPGISGEDVGTTLVFPLVKNDFKGKTTTFYVQTVQAGTINAVYAMNEGADIYNDSAMTTLDGQMATFSPDDVATMPSDCSDSTCLGAVMFTSSVEMAGVYVEANTGEDPGQILLSTRGFTPSDFDTTVVMPLIKSVWKGRTTGVQVANVSQVAASTITVTLTYQKGSASSADGETVVFTNVAPGTSRTFFPGNHGIFDGPFASPKPGDEFLGSAKITSDQPMVAICNENDFLGTSETKQTVYAGFPESAATSMVLFPLAKEHYKGNMTGIQIMNVGDDEVTLGANYVFDTGSFLVDEDKTGDPIVLQPGEPFTFWDVTNWKNLYEDLDGGFGAVTVEAAGTGDTKVVGIAQEAEWPAGANDYLDTKNYEGFNQ